MHCQIDRCLRQMAVQDKDLAGEEGTEAVEAVKAKAGPKGAITTFANVSTEAATRVPQRVSTLWHPSIHLKRGSEQQDKMLGRTSSCANGGREGASVETSFDKLRETTRDREGCRA